MGGPPSPAPAFGQAGPMMYDGDRWQPYKPDPRSVLVIGPGGDACAAASQTLKADGWNLTMVHVHEYDVAPDRSVHPSGALYPPGWEYGTPDLQFNGGKNLATLADQVIMAVIRKLVAAGKGPVAVIAGSRGGQVTLPRLLAKGWRGPTLCVNGGCVVGEIPGAPVRLILVTGGQDFFETKDPRTTARKLCKEDANQPVLLYHDPKDAHVPESFPDVVSSLLKIAVSEELFSATASTTCRLADPRAQRHGVVLTAL